jgi:hypothetical protein
MVLLGCPVSVSHHARRFLLVRHAVPRSDYKDAGYIRHNAIDNPPHHTAVLPPIHVHCNMAHSILCLPVSLTPNVVIIHAFELCWSRVVDRFRRSRMDYPMIKDEEERKLTIGVLDSFQLNGVLRFGSECYRPWRTSFTEPTSAISYPSIRASSSMSWPGCLMG